MCFVQEVHWYGNISGKCFPINLTSYSLMQDLSPHFQMEEKSTIGKPEPPALSHGYLAEVIVLFLSLTMQWSCNILLYRIPSISL